MCLVELSISYIWYPSSLINIVGTYSISDLSELTGVKTHTLRIWEKRYGLLRPQRTSTNIRYYDEQDVEMLRLVQQLNNQGVRISRIAEMSPEERAAEYRLLAGQGQDYESTLREGIKNMDVTVMDSVLDASIRQHGFEKTLMGTILPLLEKIEVMWLSGETEESNEACFREIVKRKTIREIDHITHHCSGPKVIMFLPHGNQQELSHLFMHYFLRKQGLCVTDMGCAINIDCASSALKKSHAECIIIVNEDPVHWQFGKFIRELSTHTLLPIIVSGKATDEDGMHDQDQIIFLENTQETIRFVSRLQENLRHHLS